jgi:hypothetical protein
MPIQLLFPILMILAFAGYAVWMMSKRKKAMTDFAPAVRSFFERTGYRYDHMAQAPVDQHVGLAVQEANNWKPGDRTIRYVRSFHGMPIQFLQSYESTDKGFSIACQWSVPLTQPPRIPFHIADKSLDSVGKAVREAFSNSKRIWSAKHPHRVETGIPQIDARFAVYGQDPNAVRWLLQQNPALIGLLTSCVEVDLFVDAHSATFADPVQKNMNAAMGGMVGNMALGFDMAKRMDLSIPVHERMAEILAMSVRASM